MYQRTSPKYGPNQTGGLRFLTQPRSELHPGDSDPGVAPPPPQARAEGLKAGFLHCPLLCMSWGGAGGVCLHPMAGGKQGAQGPEFGA